MYFFAIFVSTLTFEILFLTTYCNSTLNTTIPENDSNLVKYRTKILASHNRYREIHQAPKLKLNHNLTESAQQWAKQLIKFGHLMPAGTVYGENMVQLTNVNYDELDKINIVERWYEPGVSRYPNGPSSEWEHFTQIVWKSTKRLGVGIESKNKITYVVCFYDPKGNIDGLYDDNVSVNSTGLDPTGESPGVMSLWLSALVIVLALSSCTFIIILAYYQFV